LSIEKAAGQDDPTQVELPTANCANH
jgi:hypothetical protein